MQHQNIKNGMKLSEYFKIIHPKYIKLVLIPDSSVRNYNTELIASTIADFYKMPVDRIYRNGLKIRYSLLENATFEIDYIKDMIQFSMAIPESRFELIKAKIETYYPHITIKVEDICEKWDYIKCKVYEIKYGQSDIYSLHTDSTDNKPLGGLMQVVRTIKTNDKAKLYANFKPYYHAFWISDYKSNIEKIKKGIDINKNDSVVKLILNLLYAIITEVFSTFSILIGDNQTANEYEKEGNIVRGKMLLSQMSPATKRKANKNVLETSLLAISESNNENNAQNICETITSAFKELSADNELISTEIRNIKKKRNIIESLVTKETPRCAKSKFSTEEAGKVIQLPGRELQNDFEEISCVHTREISIKGLNRGNIEIGELTYRGTKSKAYWNEAFNSMSKPKVIIGSSGGGKSKYIINYCVSSSKQGYSNVIFDYIKNCEMSTDIIKHTDASRNLIFDMADLENLPGLNFCELKFSCDKNERFKTAFKIKEVIKELIENIQSESTAPLSSKMLKYLTAATLVVFIHENESIFNVYQVLQNHVIRQRYIEKAIKSEIFEKESIEIIDLITLNEYDKEGNLIGTKDSKVEGLIDRLSILTSSIHLRYMVMSKKQIDFVKLLEEGKNVVFKMPEDEFVSKSEKDIIVSCMLTKIWLAQKLRGKLHEEPRICNIVIDEIHQVPGAAKSIATFIPEVRKFGGSFVFTAQYFDQFGILQQALAGTGSSYMILAESDKNIIKTLKEEIQPFTMEDALNLKGFVSLNVINNENGRCVFISELPKPL